MTAPIRLPLAYAGFADLFQQFAPPMVETLGGLLAAFASRLDLPQSSQIQPQGEFVGFDGIMNSGDLSNLIESDWLLRELDPNDLVRRVAKREVLYRRHAFEDAGKRNTLAVVLDCGPWMLGKIRLCALAALFHLAALADRTGAELKWIVPTQSNENWHTGLTRETIAHFLGRVVQYRLDAQHLTHLRAALQAQGKLDLWYVGAGQSAQSATDLEAMASFLIETPYQHAGPDARISVRTARRRITLDVTYPTDETCFAALRRPFKPVPSARTAPSTGEAEGVLSKLPYDTDWMLDRFNQSVLLRLPDGFLWQPLLNTNAGAWIPVKRNTLVLGVAMNRAGQLTLATGTPHESQQAEVEARYDLRLIKIAPDSAEGLETTEIGSTHLNPQHFPPTSLPPLLTTQVCSLIRRDGRRMTLFGKHHEGVRQLNVIPGRVLFTDANYRVDVLTKEQPQLIVTSLNRNTVLLRRPVGSRIATLAGQARHV